MELFASKDMARVFGGFPFFPDENGVTTLCTPRWGTEKDMPAGWISVNEDFGDIVHGVLTEPEKYHKKGVEALSDACSFPDVASCFQSGVSYLIPTYLLFDPCIANLINSLSLQSLEKRRNTFATPLVRPMGPKLSVSIQPGLHPSRIRGVCSVLVSCRMQSISVICPQIQLFLLVSRHEHSKLWARIPKRPSSLH